MHVLVGHRRGGQLNQLDDGYASCEEDKQLPVDINMKQVHVCLKEYLAAISRPKQDDGPVEFDTDLENPDTEEDFGTGEFEE